MCITIRPNLSACTDCKEAVSVMLHRMATMLDVILPALTPHLPYVTGYTVTGRIAEDRANCELIAKEEVAVQQLVLMALSENPVVVKQACKTIGGC
jgi:hypothetical protein